MKRLNTIQKIINSKKNKLNTIFLILIMLLATQPVYAQATNKNIDLITGLQYGLSIIVPMIAAIILLFLLILCVFRFIARATFVRWAFSTIIAGVAFYVSNILFILFNIS
ncbi:TrbC/VirB2 family protein [Bartonella raoultii]|uniref:TrbC/VirB2 family protein n=1 Tax=Bartonella raoultii TaxID=1457020 RepID=A0ABS7I8Z8_9HYPH|nr:TrbC/VirB2 family protein [Bartonella raoultii]MBX4335902.1 TrbC/VirB2 family protein [Bartonella raoultii]